MNEVINWEEQYQMQTGVRKENKSRLSSGNACWHPVQI